MKKSAPAKFTVNVKVVDAKAPARRDKAPDYKSLTHQRPAGGDGGGSGGQYQDFAPEQDPTPNGVVGTHFMTSPALPAGILSQPRSPGLGRHQ